MAITRTHLAFLGILSIITGIIAPGTSTENHNLSYLMTDIRFLGYGVLILLIIGFILAAVHLWKWYRVITVSLFLLIMVILYMTLALEVQDIRDGSVASGLKWGWLFMIIGCIFMILSYKRADMESEGFSDTIDNIIGILGGFALACIVMILIFTSFSFFGSREKKKDILGHIPGFHEISTLSGGIRASKPYESIENLSYDRKQNTLSFISKEGGKEKYEFFGSGKVNGRVEQKYNPIQLFMGDKVIKSENGLHSIYGKNSNGVIRLSYNENPIQRDLEEVREIFVGNDGSYAYFARPLGEKNFCLFTRYRGSICGIKGYMNPTLGADGSSIIFAGYKDSVWSIYRNTVRIVKNTGYSKTQDIENDYVFFDTTNPMTYLFIEKDIQTNSYIYRKNGKVLPGIWKDVGTDVSFGYDNRIITSAEDSSGWRIIEL